MNIINKTFLKVALLPSGFYRNVGVDTYQLKSILATKLTMDDRRVSAMAQMRRRNREKQVSAATLGTMLVSALLGLIYLFAFAVGANIVTELTFYFTLFFFMLALTLISDFTSVLIDVRDNFIILPKPVSDRTFVVARLLHIFIHICKIVLPMSLAGLIKIGIDYGVFGSLVLLLIILFVTAFTIFFINAVYILILKVTTPQRFQAVISYIQIIFAVIIYAGYQLFPRVVSRMHLDDLDLSAKKGILFYPLYWFANSWQALYNFKGDTNTLIAAALGFIAPAVSLVIVVKFLAPSFNNKLALINNSTSVPQKATKKATGKSSSYASFLSSIFTKTPGEKMGFLFSWKLSSRSRDFKLKVYPAIGYLIVYVVIMFFNSRSFSLSQIQEETGKGKIIIISAVYLTSFMLVMAINQSIYSEKYKASWIFYTTPLRKPGEIICGAAKAAILKFYIPMVVFITAAGLWLVGVKILPNIILGMLNEVLIATILVYVGNKMLPFSTHQNTNVKAGSFLRNIFIFAISGLIAVGHYMIYSMLPALLICIVLSGIASWLIMDTIKNVSWEQIKSSYSDD